MAKRLVAIFSAVVLLGFALSVMGVDYSEEQIHQIKTKLYNNEPLTPTEKEMWNSFLMEQRSGGGGSPEDTGGPDDFGYIWIDSNEPGGPTFDWVAISAEEGGSGTLVAEGDDTNSGLLAILPGPFNFYGVEYTQLGICSNGWVSFTNGTSGSLSGTIPATTEPNATLAPFWNDLNPTETGTSGANNIYYYMDTANNRTIVEWYQVNQYSTANDNWWSFEIIIDCSDNTITFQYLEQNNGWLVDVAVIGIENETGTIALTVPQANLSDNYAVEFAITGFPPPMNFTAVSGLDSHVPLDWDAPPQVDATLVNYNVYMDGANIASPTETEYDVTGLTNGQMYEFWATAVYTNPDSESVASSHVFATPNIPLTLPVFYDFEASNGGFEADPPAGGWAWGTPTSGPMGAHSGVNVWGTVLEGNYVDNADWTLTTLNLDLTDNASAWMQFWHYMDCENSWDGGNVQISTDGGNTWIVIEPDGGYPDDSVVGLDSQPGYTGNSGGWVSALFYLTPYVGGSVKIRFRFGTDSSVSGYPGWYVDDFYMYEPFFGAIDGTITDTVNSIPIADVEVTVEGAQAYATSTNSVGYYIVEDVLAGTYTVNAFKPNYSLGSDSGVVVTEGDTTTVDFILDPPGHLTGWLYNGETGGYLLDVTVVIEELGLTLSNQNAMYFFENVPVGAYTVTANKEGFFPGMEDSVVITAGDTTYVDFTLYPPNSDLMVAPTSFSIGTEAGVVVDTAMLILNLGTTTTTYNISINYPEPEGRGFVRVHRRRRNPNRMITLGRSINDPRLTEDAVERCPTQSTSTFTPSRDPWDLQFVYPVGVGEGEAGIETDGNYIYTTKWNGNAFYKYELDGTYVGEFTVAGCPGSIRDLAYDGQYFYGGAASNTVYEMDFEAQTVISTINAPIAVRAIAYDSDNDGFWANNWSDEITLFDRSGNILNSFPCGTHLSYYGFAYDNFSEGGPYLWGFSQDGTANLIVQFDIATGLETGATYDVFADPLVGITTGIAGGLFIAENVFVPGTVTIGGMSQNDLFFGYELCSYAISLWLTVDPTEGRIDTTETDTIWVTFDPGDMVESGDSLRAWIMVEDEWMDERDSVYAAFYIHGGTGNIEGTVTLESGSGVLDSVVVSEDYDGYWVNPDATGYYSIDYVHFGYRTVTAELEGYVTAVEESVYVASGAVAVCDLNLVRFPPDPPTGLEGFADNETGEVYLTWDAHPDTYVDSFKVYREGTGRPQEYIGISGDTSFTDTTLTEGVMVKYLVTAVDVDVVSIPENSESDYSEPTDWIWLGYLRPENLLANGNFDDHIRLTWTEPGIPGGGEIGSILLVDDDGSTAPGTYTDVSAPFMAALTDAGFEYDYFDVPYNEDGPDAATLAEYDAVVWFTGETWSSTFCVTLSTTDEANLAAYLEGGGNLFLVGQDYFWDRYPNAGTFTAGQFPFDYLGVQSVTQDFWTDPPTCEGAAGSLAEGMAFSLINPYPGSSSLYVDQIQHDGQTTFTVDGLATCNERNTGTYKIVFFTIDFAGFVDGTPPSTTADLMANVMSFFAGQRGQTPMGDSYASLSKTYALGNLKSAGKRVKEVGRSNLSMMSGQWGHTPMGGDNAFLYKADALRYFKSMGKKVKGVGRAAPSAMNKGINPLLSGSHVPSKSHRTTRAWIGGDPVIEQRLKVKSSAATLNRSSLDPRETEDVMFYKIYRSFAGGDFDSVGTSDTLFYDDFVAENVMYSYYVTAVYDDGGESPTSDTVSAMAAMAPATPADFEAQGDGESTIILTWVDPTLNEDGSPYVDSEGINIFRGTMDPAGLLATVDPGEQYFFDQPPILDSLYTYYITALDDNGNESLPDSARGRVVAPPVSFLIYDPDPTSTGAGLQAALGVIYHGAPILYTTAAPLGDLSEYSAIFVLLGIFSNNYELQEADVGALTAYLDGGGNLYMEGGDTWYYDTPTSLHNYFNIEGTSDGSADLTTVNGFDFWSGYSWSYAGENNWIDHLVPIAPAVAIAVNPSDNEYCGVRHDAGSYRTVGTAFEIVGLSGMTEALDVMCHDFFNIYEVGVGESAKGLLPIDYALHQNYPNPFNPNTTIKFNVKDRGQVKLKVFNIRGQEVTTLVDRQMEPGFHQVNWNAEGVSSGVYFYTMKVNDFSKVRKMVLIK